MADDTNTAEREAAEQWLRDRYGAYRGHFAWRELEDAFLAGRASLAASAGSEPVAPEDYVPMLDDEGRMMVSTSHHYTAENIRALVRQLRCFADPQQSTQADWDALDWRGWCNVLARIVAALSDEIPVDNPPTSHGIEGRDPWGAFCGGRVWVGKLPAHVPLMGLPIQWLYTHPSPPEGMAGWMPIETAPKDGTLILVHFKSKGVRAVSWDSPFHDDVTDENGIWCVDDDKHGPYGLRGYNDEGPTAPTHWMPLPDPPLPASEAKEL